MGRLTFSNVPTAGGGVISGNISIGAGSPFGAGGKYEAQVADIKETISQSPEGFYDPVGWDDFLRKEELYSEELPEGFRIYGIEDPEVLDALLDNQQAQRAVQELAIIRKRYLGHKDRVEFKTGREYQYNTGFGIVAGDKLIGRIKYLKEYIALSFDRVLKEKNAPIIQAIEQRERQLEIDKAVKLALEQKIRETATSKPKPTPEPSPASTISILPIIIIAVALIGVLLFLRSRA